MKKIVILSLAAMMAVGFASDLKFSGTMVQGLSLASGQTYGFGAKNKINFNAKVSDVTTFVYQQDLNNLGVPNQAYVDTLTSIGMFRLGNQTIALSNLYGGLYQDSSFYTKTKVDATAITYMTNLFGSNVGIGFAGGLNNASKCLAIKADKVAGTPVSVLLAYADNNASKSGFGIGAEMKANLGAIDGFIQAYMDLSDDAATAIAASAKARTYIAGGVSMAVSGTPVVAYVDALMAASDGAKTAFGNETEIKVGAKLPLNADVTAGAEYTNLTGAAAANSTVLSAEIRF